MSETTAIVRIRTHNRFVDGNWRFVLEWPSGATTSGYELADLERLGLPVPPKPIPDPPESGTVRDAYATVWVEECGGCWINVHGGRQTWPKLIATRGPLTELIPGDPIEAP